MLKYHRARVDQGMSNLHPLPAQNNGPVPDDRLQSWKEIAAYLRRGVRTVRRWEKEEGLPVHRHVHKKLGTVYAHRAELDVWLGGRRGRLAAVTTAEHPPRRTLPRTMIAVLPFHNLGQDSEQDYFSDGLTEEMISHFGRLQPESLAVIARTTMMQYRGTTRTAREIGAELRVNYLLEGSVRVEKDWVRVTARLVDVRDQVPVWARTYDQPMRSILAVQSELAADIVGEIRLQIGSPLQAPSAEQGGVDPVAYRTHLMGRHLLNSFRPAAVQRSIELFRRAIDADPGYGPSYASLAEAYERLPMWTGVPSRETYPLALEAVEKALDLDPELPDALASLGLIHANYLWNWAKAEECFKRALELNPGCSQGRQWYAEFLAEMGRSVEAQQVLEPARISDPLSSVIQSTRAFVLVLDRRFDEAIAQAQEVLELDQQYPMALIRLGFAYAGKELYDEAVRAFEAAEQAAPGLVDCVALQGYAHGRAGDRHRALERLAALRTLADERYVPPFLFGNIHLGLEEYDEAIRYMEQEYAARGWYLLLIGQGPQFDPLRAHPRFQALVQAMNFPG
jgi:TolB-like protein/tetratricopeptide (TPR) repeat protein